MTRPIVRALFALIALPLLLTPISASAQAEWQYFPRPSFAREALAAVIHDNELIVGGYILSIHQVQTKHVAKWNGASWEAVGAASGRVSVLASSGGALYYGSAPVVANNQGDVSRFDGSSWSRVGTLTVVDDYVRIDAMIDFGGSLVVSGRFEAVDGIPVEGLALFDGSTWSAIGSGPAGPGDRVTALASYQGDLVAAGEFSIASGGAADGIARWTGSAWVPFGDGLADAAVSLVEFDGQLWAGFWTPSTTPAGSEVRRWDGSAWSAAGNGVASLCGFYAPVASKGVLDLAVHDGQLFLGGTFTTGFTSDGYMAGRWNGTAWERMNSFGGEAEDFAANWSVRNLLSFEGHLVLTGYFPRSGAESIENISAWTGSGFVRVADDETGLDNVVNDVALADEGVVVAGNFDEAGIVKTGPVARWDGVGWNAYGLLPSDRIDGYVQAVLAEGSDVYVGGVIFMPDGSRVDVAHFDGTVWTALGGEGDAPTLDLTWFEGNLVAGTSDRVRVWDGSSWDFLGSMPAGAYVRALTMFDGKLHAAVTFGGPNSPRPDVFRLDGDQWTSIAPFGTYSTGWALALTVHDGSLVLGGGIQGIGEVASPGVIAWDGATWSPRVTAIDREVRALASTPQGLVIGGNFRSLDGSAIRGFALEDSLLGWTTVAGSPTTSVSTLLPYSGSLWVGGGFTGSLGSTKYVAVWHPSVTTGVDAPATVRALVVEVVPNPFNPYTAFRFAIDRSSVVSIDVFDVSGRRVRTVLAERRLDAGDHVIGWDGRDDAGLPVASGMYLYRVEGEQDVAVGKLTLLK